MRRIVVIGSSGAGKSTLSQQLGDHLQVPVIHLDRLFWRPGWEKTPEAERVDIVTHLVAGEKWIIDGTYRKTLDIRLQAADTIILLDLPRWICVYRAVKRRFQYRYQKRQDIADDCDESLFNISFPRFLRKIWNYPERARPGIIQRLEQVERLDGTKNIITLQSTAAVNAFRADPQTFARLFATQSRLFLFSNGRTPVSIF
jgi:adenylate kinase family enzyme